MVVSRHISPRSRRTYGSIVGLGYKFLIAFGVNLYHGGVLSIKTGSEGWPGDKKQGSEDGGEEWKDKHGCCYSFSSGDFSIIYRIRRDLLFSEFELRCPLEVLPAPTTMRPELRSLEIPTVHTTTA